MPKSPRSSLPTVPLKQTKTAKRPATAVGKSPADPQVIVRLMPSIDDVFRNVVKYRGDVSISIIEALNTVDLNKASVVDLSADRARLRTTTARLPRPLYEKCKAVAERRDISVNELFNTAVAHWLAGKDLINLA